MTDEELAEALRTLGPSGRLPGQALFAMAAIEAAGLDAGEVSRWASARGGGPFDAGAVKLRKGQRPEDGRVGRPEGFIAVPESALS